MKNFLAGVAMLFAAATVCVTSNGQEVVPQTVNAKLEVRDAGANLGATIEQLVTTADGPMWIGYGVDEIAGRDRDCCGATTHYGKDEDGTVLLENEDGNRGARRSGRREAKSEGGRKLLILMRAAKGRMEKLRFAPASCRLDAGGLKLVWLEGAEARQSLRFLSGIVKRQEFSDWEERGMGEQALTAIALHSDAAADQALEAFAAQGQPGKLRERAAFWMGATRGEAGFKALQKMARTDPSSDFRAQVSFDLFVSQQNGATEEIMRMAREDASPHVRGQALFWLAQKAGQKAAKTIAGAIADDPDTEVKTKAVFALSQMPEEEGVPKLIEVAEKNKNPEVRKAAMFWLGESGDPRALAFFEKVLGGEKRD